MRLQGASAIDPTTEEFFRSSDKTGGPTEVDYSFKDVYTDIFIRKLQKVQDSFDNVSEQEDQDQSVESKKKRGRKPKQLNEDKVKQEQEDK